MIDWSTIEFVTYKTFLETTILKSIIWFIVTRFISIKFSSTIRWFISTIIIVSSVLFISEIVIVDFIFRLMILILMILMLLLCERFSYDLVIDNAKLQNIDQCRSIRWWIDQFENQNWMISACSNDVFL